MAAEYERFFPKPEPYPNQAEAMDVIADALEVGRDVLFEGAPGTGKTLAALAPSLAYAREHDKTVVITTNVHQQMHQFVEEAREIHAETPIRSAVFKGKSSMCHIDVGYEECQVLRDTTRDLVELEEELDELKDRERRLLDQAQAGSESATEKRQSVLEEIEALEEQRANLEDSNTCEHYRTNLTRAGDAFVSWLFDDVRTPTEVYSYAEQQGVCGYERLKEGLDGVELVVANYHHLLDPVIRSQFFRWLDRDPEDVIAVFDEAHNVEDAARDHATRTLTENTLAEAANEAGDVEDSRADAALRIIQPFQDALIETYEANLGFGDRERVGSTWQDVPVANETGRDDLTRAFLDRYTGPGISTDLDEALKLGTALDEEYETAYREGDADTRRESQTLAAADFIEGYLEEGDETGQYPTLGIRRDESTNEVYGRAELFNCIPREVTETLFEEVHATVLMSATLRPFDVLSEVLGLDDPAELAFGLTFPEQNRRTFAVDVPPLFASRRDDPGIQEVLTDTLSDVVRFTPGNTLLFFPSYAEAERYYDRLSGALDATLFLDEPGVAVEEKRQSFVERTDGVLFTSLWGTLAEGVSFDGDDARSVAVVGVPYPRLDERSEAIQDAYDEVFGDREPEAGWRYAVEIPTVRKTRQALGRVIRSPSDIGVRALIDRRYTPASRTQLPDYTVNPDFPPEERAELIDVEPSKLKYAMLNFFRDRDAWDGQPPTP
ncbi:ATP-dependent DNA helicase [Halodesulfurarchaeum formicicum]|uniref:DEAD/DEAH box helicase n=1 Tax=Halodesulfurarchaeum formicicum TaxID=1873524 RepID=A0A1J1AEI8_9EURY|nr:ATP-dependent DNA helicase [Halodesulfurarchaeum formicicum]APE96554.1 DEAD/DEAH box helicase [Halodesulfurarchaeum formicicum]